MTAAVVAVTTDREMIATDRSIPALHLRGHATWATSEVTGAILLVTNIQVGTAQLADIRPVMPRAMLREINRDCPRLKVAAARCLQVATVQGVCPDAR